MAKGRKTGGRRPGSQNKITTQMKIAMLEAFNALGGVPALVAWGQEERTEFYRLAARLIPTEVTGKDGGPIETRSYAWLPPPKS